MKSLFEIQTESGQLWVDIAAHLAEKDAIIASLQPGYVAPPVSEKITAFAALLWTAAGHRRFDRLTNHPPRCRTPDMSARTFVAWVSSALRENHSPFESGEARFTALHTSTSTT